MVGEPGDWTGRWFLRRFSDRRDDHAGGRGSPGHAEHGAALGFNLVSSQVPQAGKLGADLKYTAAEGDIVYQWDAAAQGYKAANGFEFGEWSGGEPTIGVGEGFSPLSKAAAGSCPHLLCQRLTRPIDTI